MVQALSPSAFAVGKQKLWGQWGFHDAIQQARSGSRCGQGLLGSAASVSPSTHPSGMSPSQPA